MKNNLTQYLKQRLIIVVLLLTIISIFTVIRLLEYGSIENLVYALILALFFIVIFGFYDYYRYTKSIKAIHTNLQIINSDGTLCDLDDLDENYLKLLHTLEQRLQSLKSTALANATDQEDYYSLWVHQIKVPITAIDLTLQASPNPNPLVIQNEVLKIRQYVDMVLNFIKINGLQNDFVFKTFDIDLCIKLALHKLAPLFIQKKLNLVYPSQSAFVLSDIKWIDFVVEQLLSNAIKYTNKGTVTIEFKDDVLTISDTGLGIEQSDLPRIFEKGYTGYNGRINQHASGLGLYLTKSILDKLNHPIRITSKVDFGTQVCIDFSHKSIYSD